MATTPGVTLTDPHPLDRKSIKLLSVGITEAVQDFPALPNVSRELETIHQLYGGTSLLNKQFMMSRVQEELKAHPYSVMHIASHGQFQSDSNETFLLAYDGKMTMDRLEEYVGMLRFREEPLALITLSACETAEFLHALAVLLVKDSDTLKQCASLLSAKERKPLSKDDAFGIYRFIIAEKALSFFSSHRVPIKEGLIIDLVTYARDARMSDGRTQQMLQYAKKLLRTKIPDPDRITSKILQFKHQNMFAAAVNDLMEKQEAGKLNLAAFSKAYHSLAEATNGNHQSNKRFFEGLEDRIERRSHPRSHMRYPLLYIDPLDRMISTVGGRVRTCAGSLQTWQVLTAGVD